MSQDASSGLNEDTQNDSSKHEERPQELSGSENLAEPDAEPSSTPPAVGDPPAKDISIEEVGNASVGDLLDPVKATTPKVPMVVANTGDPSITLAPAGLSAELVTLSGNGSIGVASYDRAAGKALGSAWRRTTLFFTSAGAHEGATEAAVNLATMMSRRTESVLLVELQLTEPGLWQLLGQPPVTLGLERALRGEASFEDCLQNISGEKLKILLVRQPVSALEAEHLPGALNDFLEWAEERFAWMVVDCPPVLGPAWTRWFDLNADPVVLVARREKTIKHQFRRAAKHLGDRLAGTVLSSAAVPNHMPKRDAPASSNKPAATSPVFPPVS